MAQTPLKYNADDPEGEWLLLRTVTEPDADWVATQTRPADDLLIGTPPPGPPMFAGLRFFMRFFDATDPSKTVTGGSWSAQMIEVGIFPEIGIEHPIMVLGGEQMTGLSDLQVSTVGGWRSGAISVRVSAVTFPDGADSGTIYIREF